MNFNDNIIINENFNCFRKSLGFYLTFNILLIEIVKVTALIKRSFALIEFNKIKIYSIQAIQIDILLKSFEINNKNK